jgi:hypothetical protein
MCHLRGCLPRLPPDLCPDYEPCHPGLARGGTGNRGRPLPVPAQVSLWLMAPAPEVGQGMPSDARGIIS